MIQFSHSPSLRHIPTAHLAQTMTLLGLTAVELRQKVESELASNPALELISDRRCPTCHRRLPEHGPCLHCSHQESPNSEQPIIFLSPREDFHSGSGYSGEELPNEEWAPAIEELPAYVLRQIAPDLEPQDRPIAAHILTGLNEDGLLSFSLLEVARYHHIPLARVEKVQKLIQRADPVGVASATPQEAMLVQLENLEETRPVPAATGRAIREGMDLLSHRAHAELAKRLKLSLAQVQEIASFISNNLNPFPARAHWGENGKDPDAPIAFHDPDIIVSKLHNTPDSPLVVEIVAPYAGMLRIDPLFRESLAQAPEDKAEDWQALMERASLLIKCLQQRNHTIVRLMQKLVVLQRKFILQGDAYLSPVTRACLALELEVHESTVSRAVSGKAVQLPNGHIVPLSRLFDRSLHVRTALRQIIAQETLPLSDTQIAHQLGEQGFPVARRTVAKYRAMEGILPARYRQIHPIAVLE